MQSLADIMSDWLNNHRYLKDHFKVLKREDWPDPPQTWIHEADAVIWMPCYEETILTTPGAIAFYGIMSDHVFHSVADGNSQADGSRERYINIKFMAADKDFFVRIENDLTQIHYNNFNDKLCKVEEADASHAS